MPKAAYAGIAGQLRKARHPALVTHRKPDGDALGSTVALGQLLQRWDKEVSLVCVDPVPAHYRFLRLSERFVTALPDEADMLVLLDCGDDKLSGIEVRSLGLPVIDIDHHPKPSGLPDGWRRLHSTEASSTAELLHDFLQSAGATLDRDMATALLTGIISDTSAFQNSNTTPHTLQVAARLLAAGANRKEIVRQCFFTSSIPKLRLWGRAMARIEQNSQGSGIVSTVLTREDIAECGAHADDIEGLVNFLNAIPGVPALLLLTDLHNGVVKGSFRTRNQSIDVSKLAALLGGGGHHQAAGFALPGRLVRNADDSWDLYPPEFEKQGSPR